MDEEITCFDDIQNYRIIGPIGYGSFAQVYSAMEIASPPKRLPQIFALKVINRRITGNVMRDERRLKIQREEILIHKVVSGMPGIIKVLDSFETQFSIYIVTELASQGDLCEQLMDVYYSSADVQKWFSDTLEAIKSCHNAGVFHRDIKPENLLRMADGSIKLCDFGLATREVISFDYGIGTTPYMSPNVYCQFQAKAGYRPASCDIWSLGVLLFTLITRKTPWKEPSFANCDYRSFVFEPVAMLSESKCSRRVIDILLMCWRRKEGACSIEQVIDAFKPLTHNDLQLVHGDSIEFQDFNILSNWDSETQRTSSGLPHEMKSRLLSVELSPIIEDDNYRFSKEEDSESDVASVRVFSSEIAGDLEVKRVGQLGN
eukprot:Partr_v1_DN25586_c0_g1_i2_m20540 putative serine threonine protein kinase